MKGRLVNYSAVLVCQPAVPYIARFAREKIHLFLEVSSLGVQQKEITITFFPLIGLQGKSDGFFRLSSNASTTTKLLLFTQLEL